MTCKLPPDKERIDVLLVQRGLAESREQAQKLVMAGLVIANDHRIDKPGTKVSTESSIRVKGRLPYVSRGGLKLEKGMKEFAVDFTGSVVIDVGSSTGGFTDLAVQNGAKRVYAVDSGTNQLHHSLRIHPYVVCLEQTNFRTIAFDTIGEYADILVTDVSFISLKLIIPSMVQFAKDGTKLIALIKPQFEAGRAEVGKNGVVKDKKVHERVIHEVIAAAAESGFTFAGLTASPITGPKGNIEYLGYFIYNATGFGQDTDEAINRAVYADGSDRSQTPR